MKLKLLLRIDKTNSRGEIIDTQVFESRSLLYNFALFTAYILGLVPPGGYLGVNIYGQNVDRYCISGTYYQFRDIFNAIGGEGNSQLGIVVGSGTTPVSISDYKLESWITHGTGTNQLLYGSTIPEGVTTTSFSIARSFTNSGTSYVTVNEVGLITFASTSYTTITPRLLLIVRDIVPGGVVVGPGQGLVVRYIFTISA